MYLQVDMHKPVSDHRKARCTGTALQVAAGLLDLGITSGAQASQLLLFVGGPCTEGAAHLTSVYEQVRNCVLNAMHALAAKPVA